MPVSKIQVNEYHCIKRGYKWINRVNGKDGPIPKRCAKCKTSNWDRDAIRPKENGLRRGSSFNPSLKNHLIMHIYKQIHPTHHMF